MKLWDPYAEHFDDPFPMYHRLREHAPIYRSQSGDYVVTGYNEIKSILLDSKNFRVGNRYEWISRQVSYLESKEENLIGITDAMGSFLVQLNAPEHTVIRKLMVDAWDDHQVDHIIKENINILLGKHKKERFDLMNSYAVPLPVMTMAHIMGMQKEEYEKLKDMSSRLILCLDMYTSFKTLVTINEAAHEFIAYINAFLDYKESNLSTDLTSKIILLAKKRGLDLSRKQLASMLIFLFMAGEETTVSLIGSGTYHLLRQPSTLTTLRNDLNKWDDAVEELLRHESPVQLAGRIANRDITIADVNIEKEATLTLSLGAANRDPEKFINPDNFDIDRHDKNHLAFGAGAHFCIGNWLAKQQWKLAIKELFDRFPNLQLDGTPKWSPTLSIRCLSSLPVRT